METKDLRIGNYVKHNSEWCYRGEDVYEFQWCASDWYALGECTLFMENIEPIQLTEEWLLKFGFEIAKKGDYTRWYYTVFIREDLISISNSHGFLSNFKYVHQLQNLYFALTGEELTIKN